MTYAPDAARALANRSTTFKQSIESRTRFNARLDRRAGTRRRIHRTLWLQTRFHKSVKFFATLSVAR
jgi:hypothetical protein